jgi:brefeldin A-inhibited guanine nucleotide-exchange protein
VHGKAFSQDFWEVIAKGTLFPIFDDLRLSRKEHTSLASKEDMSVWLSTTLIQALRQLIDLQTFYFEELAFLLDDVLDILVVCITQENESLSRLGSTCFQQLIESNYEKMDDELWRKITSTLIHLLESTIPEALFFDPYETLREADEVAEPRTRNGRRLAPKPEMKDFQRIIVKCVLHHLIILTVQEILACAKGNVIRSMKTEFVLELADSIYESYKFASDFNADKELRQALFELKFMKQPPNLLKQELTSISTYTWVLGQIFAEESPERLANREGIESRLIP